MTRPKADRSEAHLSEAELAAALAVAFESGWLTAKTGT